MYVFAFFALIPLLILLENKSISVSLRLGFISGLISNIIALFWLYLIFKTFSLILFCILAVFWGIFAVIFTVIRKSINYKFALMTTPISWVAIEFFRAEQWKLKFGWLALGYSQHSNKYLLIAAKYIGVYGITAVIVAISVVIILFFKYRDRTTRLTAACFTFFLLLFILYANISKEISYTDNKMQLYGIQVEGNFNKCMELTLKTPMKSNSMVVFPEYSLLNSPLQNKRIEQKILDFIKKINSYFVFGCMEFVDNDKKPFNNIALIYSPLGKLIGKYQKHHPIQFFMDGSPGTGYPVFSIPEGILGVGICYDFDYIDVARNLTKKGAMLLIVPTFDALDWGKTQHIQHAGMMPFRAVETGRYIFRPASSGISMVLSPDGTVIKQLDFNKTGVFKYEVPLLTGKTFFVEYGYYFTYLCQFLCILLLLGSLKNWFTKERINNNIINETMFIKSILTLTLIILSADRVWANSFLPIYSTGFGFFTSFVSLPAIILGESIILWYLSKGTLKHGSKSLFSVCLSANFVSAIIGIFFLPFLIAFFNWIWGHIADSVNPTIIMRQIFLASYLITICLEAMVYQGMWEEKKHYYQKKDFGCGVYMSIASVMV
ncbi:apolipoprotein N-acyltransferase [Elusimicrobiota bacterium]